jgi:hypothetical protein
MRTTYAIATGEVGRGRVVKTESKANKRDGERHDRSRQLNARYNSRYLQRACEHAVHAQRAVM